MANQSKLWEFHKAHNAVFMECATWLLPRHFGNFTAEYEAVRTRVGLIDRSHRGLLQLTGPDRLSYLQGMVSNDLRALKPGEGQYATFLNQQGKVLGDVRVLCSENSFYLDLWEAIKDKIVAHLNRYLVADEVEIANKSEGYGILSIQGPRSQALLQKLLGQAELPRRLMQHAMVAVDGASVCVVRSNHTGETGFDLIVPKSDLMNIAERTTEMGKSCSATWIGEEAQNILRIEAGIPLYGVDFTENNLLLETGLNNAVSFTKGCYLGQEVIERIRSRGHVNKRLMGLLLDGKEPATTGDLLHSGNQEVGIITSAVWSPSLRRPIALGYVHKDFWTPGTTLSLDHGGVSIATTVADLPFIRAEDVTLESYS
jgi:glycine cleavage system T protein